MPDRTSCPLDAVIGTLTAALKEVMGAELVYAYGSAVTSTTSTFTWRPIPKVTR